MKEFIDKVLCNRPPAALPTATSTLFSGYPKLFNLAEAAADAFTMTWPDVSYCGGSMCGGSN